jgi:uncharacterized protein (TIGR03086 family)
MIDLTPACKRTADVLMNVIDEQLNGPTACARLSVRDLVAHVGGLAPAFTAAARKEFGELTDTPPVEGVPLDEDWRTAYPARLAELARAWRDPAAWEGMTRACGVDFPGEVGGIIALTEVVIHGWDVAARDRTGLRRRPGHSGRGAAARDRDRRRRPGRGAVRARSGRRRRCAEAGSDHCAERTRPCVGFYLTRGRLEAWTR